MREVEKNEANYVVIISNAYTKRVEQKFYFDLDRDEGIMDMLEYVNENYGPSLNLNSRIEFARVLMGNSLRREL